jgi:lysozyme
METSMQTSSDGRALIEHFEGLRLTAYRDSVGVLTIGYGHTSAAGSPKVVPGMRITEARADQILATDLAKFEKAVSAAIKVSITQHEFDACVSLCFNVGPGNFSGSSVVSRLNRGDKAGAAAAFLMWTKAGGRVLPGLVTRRRAEAALFNSDPHAAISLAAANDHPFPIASASA